MTTDIIEMNNFIVLIEQSNADKTIVQKCEVDRDIVGFAFYGSGNVSLSIKYEDTALEISNTTGIAISFFSNSKVEFAHTISPNKPLQSISVFTKVKNLDSLPDGEKELFHEYLSSLMNPKSNFVKGPSFYMTPDMQNAVHKILNSKYKGNARVFFLKSQVNELLSHFFALLASDKGERINETERDKLYQAKEIIENNISQPPSLNELSKLIGLNNNKLKKNFKELFGIPVFKYLHEERLNKAHELLCNTDMSVQETAWYVGYESLSSFSNAFHKKFGTRPNEIRQQFFSNKS